MSLETYQVISMHESEDEKKQATISLSSNGPVKVEFTEEGNTRVKFFVDLQRAEDAAEDFVLGT